MRYLVVLILAVILSVVAPLGPRLWRFYGMAAEPSAEVTDLTPAKRLLLTELRAERKFQPHDYPPFGYTGAETLADETNGTRAVDGVIDGILARSNGPLPARAVSDLIGEGMRKVTFLATEDRDRAREYMLEIWYLLGFKDATGRFAYGSAYKAPPGYGEPLPPGWASPTQPRSFGR